MWLDSTAWDTLQLQSRANEAVCLPLSKRTIVHFSSTTNHRLESEGLQLRENDQAGSHSVKLTNNISLKSHQESRKIHPTATSTAFTTRPILSVNRPVIAKSDPVLHWIFTRGFLVTRYADVPGINLKLNIGSAIVHLLLIIPLNQTEVFQFSAPMSAKCFVSDNRIYKVLWCFPVSLIYYILLITQLTYWSKKLIDW